MKEIYVYDLNIPELTVYQERKEAGLLHCQEPAPGLFIAESPNVIRRALAAGYEPVSFLAEERLADNTRKLLAECCQSCADFSSLPFYIAKGDLLENITGYPMTRGVLGAFRRKFLPDPSALLSRCRRVAVLENVMNPTNLGAIFRSAAALNMDAVLLTRGCTDPLYRRAIRVSMGTVFQIPWTFFGTPSPSDTVHPCAPADPSPTTFPGWMSLLRMHGFRTAAMALTDDCVSVRDPRIHQEKKLAVILGTEGPGLLPETIASSDYTIKIPMSHDVDSLNVAAASAIAFWELGQN